MKAMKKKSLLIMLFILLCMVPASAQIRWGMKSGVSFNELYKHTHSHDIGWFVGPMAEFALPITGMGIEGALLYHQVKYDTGYKDHFFEIPLNLKWYPLCDKTWKAYLAVGPQFTYIWNKEDYYYNHTAFSFNLGGGIELFRHWQVSVHYNLPLGRTLEHVMLSVPNPDREGGELFISKRRGWLLSAAYLF